MNLTKSRLTPPPERAASHSEPAPLMGTHDSEDWQLLSGWFPKIERHKHLKELALECSLQLEVETTHTDKGPFKLKLTQAPTHITI